MICNFTHFSIALLWFLPAFSSAQTEPMDLSLEALAKREQKPQDCREGSGAGEE